MLHTYVKKRFQYVCYWVFIGWDGAVAIFLSSYYCYLRLPPKNYEIYAINNFDWMKSVIIVEEAELLHRIW